MKIYVITWTYGDSTKCGVFAAFKDKAAAEEMLEKLQTVGDVSKSFAIFETIIF